MTTSLQSLRTKSISQAKLKLSQHRELGTKSSMNVFEVAELLDSILFAEHKIQNDQKSFDLILN
ncbi:MAG: hypothetical protein NWR96_08590 [Crocinitomicaceae bacterium]|jgi:hypothetical protein|nr:hypothetical protein [Crocinitomicaceae bacterium]MDP4761679.1 hypothetical protein [Crocinitomicaceae bacterium]